MDAALTLRVFCTKRCDAQVPGSQRRKAMIGSIGSYSVAQPGGNAAIPVASTVKPTSDTPSNQGSSGTQSNGTQTISTLARQLTDSASRAEARDRTLTRSELADKAKSILNNIVGDSYYANKTLHDSEIPKTSDPELLSRAKQATAFVNDASRGGHSIKNPFSGLSRILLRWPGHGSFRQRHREFLVQALKNCSDTSVAQDVCTQTSLGRRSFEGSRDGWRKYFQLDSQIPAKGMQYRSN